MDLRGAREALRKARNTASCWLDPGDCYCEELGEDYSRAPQGDLIHLFAPSVLLDGYPVDLITRAGG